MTKFINKFKIPTLLGLGIIILGLAGGLFLIIKDQNYLTKAAPDLIPKNITVTNITESSATISWQTNSAVPSLVSVGQSSPGEFTTEDDRDNQTDNQTKSYLNHYVTLKNLLPKTDYQFKIISGKIISEIEKFQTASPLSSQLDFNPIVGSVMDGENSLDDGIVYLLIPGAVTQSFLIKAGGNFLIPLSQIRKENLSDTLELAEDSVAKLTVRTIQSDTEILFKLKAKSKPLPTIKVGENIDLTDVRETPEPSTKSLGDYDLNDDGKINAADYAIVLQNFGKKPKSGQSDLNNDGLVDKKDLELLNQKVKDLSSE